MLTRTSEYAIRAVIHLAQNPDEWPISGKCIAEQAGIPPKYLSKVLGDLVRVGVLVSTRGKGGGFGMMRSPRQTKLIDVLAPFEQFEQGRCPFGNQCCSDEYSCLAHSEWKKVMKVERDFLSKTTIYAVATGRTSTRPAKRRRRRVR